MLALLAVAVAPAGPPMGRNITELTLQIAFNGTAGCPAGQTRVASASAGWDSDFNQGGGAGGSFVHLCAGSGRGGLPITGLSAVTAPNVTAATCPAGHEPLAGGNMNRGSP